MPLFDLIAFDADDTLWHNERLYNEVQNKYKTLLSQYHSPEWIEDRLYQTEIRNLQHFGYGVKAFALSMIETAIELTEGRITGSEIQVVINLAREMLTADIELLEYTADTVAQLATTYPLMLLTKGDLLDQQSKIARSNIAHHFQYIEIVSDKRREGYEAILKKYHVAPERFLMVGNSLRSDILPVLEIGGHGVYIPYMFTWAHEVAELPPAEQAGFYQLEHIGLLPALLKQLEEQA